MVMVLWYEKEVLGSGIDLTIQSVTDGLQSGLRELGTRSSLLPCFIGQRIKEAWGLVLKWREQNAHDLEALMTDEVPGGGLISWETTALKSTFVLPRPGGTQHGQLSELVTRFDKCFLNYP